MTNRNAMYNIFDDPIKGRTEKPREKGITFISDFGFGLNRVEDFIGIAGDYVDRVKIAFGSVATYKEDYLRKKIELLKAADIDINPGGTCGEIAMFYDAFDSYLDRIKALGFNTVEVSDGTIQITDDQRELMIKKSIDSGLKVVSEIGKKDERDNLLIDETLRQIERDIKFGVKKVIIEARGTAKGIGLFDSNGKVKESEVDMIAKYVDIDNIIWEAPQKPGQVYFVNKFGPNVNLGNVRPDEIIAVESMRRGLRGDTWRPLIIKD
ncbi:MAG: phosphosulfolactate synthase [Eubacteriales bacterium]